MKQKIKKNILSFILTIVLFSSITVIASTLYSTSISVDPTNISGLDSNSTLDDAITGLYLKAATSTCPSGYKCYKTHGTPQVGDYVKMTPTSTSFRTDTTKTGYTSTQTLKTSELNLWRVIRVNGDGTIEMVSENVSSTDVYFRGQTGYKNLVGYLNEIAKQYENNKYTVGSRHMGYNGQTEYLIDTANTVDSTATTPPWTSDTNVSNTVESQGGGDALYQTDTNLVETAIGTLKAPNLSGSTSDYYLASRYYSYSSANYWYYNGRYINTSGALNSSDLYRYNSSFSAFTLFSSIRPIVVLKSGISYTEALGTMDDPFILE